MASHELTSLLAKLAAGGVELIVVGGLAAVAQGAPITTFDLDIVPRRSRANIARLLAVLAEVDAHVRGHPTVQRPTADILMGRGHALLVTTHGPLDVLGAIEAGRDYEALVADSIAIEVGGHPTRVLRLETIVELKRASRQPKDQRMLPLLEAALARRR